MLAKFLTFFILGSSLSMAGEVQLARKFSKTACYVNTNSVYFIYMGEEVGGRDHLLFNTDITSVNDLKDAVLAAKHEGNVVIANGAHEADYFKGDMALDEEGSLILVGAKGPASQKLKVFLDLNCQGE